ncbi:hypothetical protein HN807_11200 [Candidatus Bathyarchaeota archaeon]|nr:hypothetical protein [Candidatus Bathyarchaeota archaeon]MBT4320872.1 hypothetical protein [Candidatus Bathyarchaeota archaeon]MBT4423145.1 hypothetical protein [Candidatus Bathyarchaeota archaeon]MBT5642572.1 hypothetical protein [Candidatus Bathyarchaeota archaeon]MBT6605992.1 hypothetical protein [Candidatus Bathyarchaeota archaeon]
MINEKQSMYIAIIALVIAVLAIGITYTTEAPAGLTGPEGPQGVAGPDGADGSDGAVGPAGAQGESYTQVAEAETCVVCHEGAGADHQADYDDYNDESNLAITIDSVSTTGTTSVMTVTIMKDGAAYVEDDLSDLDQARFYAMAYDSATGMWDGRDEDYVPSGYVRYSTVAAIGGGQYTITASGVTYDIETSDAIAYAYIAQGPLDVEAGGSHVHLYADVASAGISYGAADEYESVAVVSGCEKCHGEPYGKHGYRQAEVEGLSDFASCKVCHYDDRKGGHQDWLVIPNDPVRYTELHAGDDLTEEEEIQYSYMATVMQDTHITHAMEFPYPQSMSNCVTCHEGKLDMILTDDYFTIETCKSCHAVTGSEEYDTAEYALATVLPAVHDGMNLDTVNCASCHSAAGGFPVFSEIHSGYDKQVYTADGVKYADAVVITIDETSVSDDVVTVKFSATSSLAAIDVADIEPTVMVGMYGWDTKDYIIGPHERLVDDNGDGEISRSSGDDRALEYGVGDDDHPRGATVSAADGSWEVTVDMSTWGNLIDDGTVSRIEVAVMGELVDADDVELAINAVSKTYDLATAEFVDYYDPITDVEGCNTCHEALGITFHGPDRGGSIVVCRMCHITKSRGSHLELQSRSIDSYVHAIHSFQAYDIGDVDFTDAVEATRYETHVAHTMPLFTIKDCEACHNEGTYEVPDQSKSLPGALSATDSVDDRDIGDYPIYLTGPATRACGGCHRTDLINADDAGGLEILFQHMKAGGYLIAEVDDYAAELGTVIDDIMYYFK